MATPGQIEKGVIAALVTPLNEDETVDVPSLQRLVEWVLSSSVRGFFIAGTIGEGSALRDREKGVLFKETVKAVAGRVPVLAGISEMGTLRALELLQVAEAARVDAVVLSARLTFPRRTHGETLRHVQLVASRSSCPVWFYEIPANTGFSHTFDEIREILTLPNVIGLKFSSPDLDLYRRCISELPEDIPVLTGNTSDIALAGFLGAGGAISGIGSLLPGLCVRTYRAAVEGNREEAERLQKAISASYSIYGGEGWPYWPTAQKHALKRRGIIRTSISAAPFLQLGLEDERNIDQELDRMDESLFEAC